MADNSARSFDKVKQANSDMTEEEMVAFYHDFAPVYDETLVNVDYGGPALAAKYFALQKLPKDCRVLDVAAGTGLVAQILHDKYGSTNIDAHDGSQDMLEAAKKRNIYNNTICSFIGGGYKLPIEDDTYDGAVMCGALAPGHLKCDSFLEIIRVVKPGGIIVNAMREENTRKVEEYKKLHPLFDRLEQEGKWQRVDHVIPEEKYYVDYDALVHIYRVK